MRYFTSRAASVLLGALLLCLPAFSQASLQAADAPEHLILVLPFENTSKNATADWLSEAFAEVISQRLAAEDALIISRADRLYAYEHLGIPAAAHPSRATVIKLAEEMDVDLVITGSFVVDGKNLTARAQMLNVKSLRLTPEIVEGGSLNDVMNILQSLAWDMLHSTAMHGPPAGDNFANKQAFVKAVQSPGLDVFEKYMRGVTAAGEKEKIALLREAVKMSPDYNDARFALGKALFTAKDYDEAIQNLRSVNASSPRACEARFYAGLAEIWGGHPERAEELFLFVVERLPLIEALNDLGVAQARRGKKNAVEQFHKATEADETDADYHFNYGVSLWRAGAAQEALEQWKTALTLRPGDSEIRAVYDAVASGKQPDHAPLERVKTNYDETSYRQLQLEIERARRLKPRS